MCWFSAGFSLYDQASANSRCMAVVESDDFWRNEVLKACVTDACTDNYSNMIFISYKDAPNCSSHLEDNEALRVAYRLAYKVKWPGENSKQLQKFWVKLRQKLPPLPKTNGNKSDQVTGSQRELKESVSPLLSVESQNGIALAVTDEDNQNDDVFLNSQKTNEDSNQVYKKMISNDSGLSLSISP